MTVKELIRILSVVPSDTEVVYGLSPDDILGQSIYLTISAVHFTKEVVFLTSEELEDDERYNV